MSLYSRFRGSRQLQALVATVVGSSPGLILPFALTGRFGVGRITDAYFFGFAIATVVTALAVAVLEANVLPSAHKAKLYGCAELRKFTRRLSRQAMGVVSAAYVPATLLGFGLLLTRDSWTHDQRVAAAEVMAVCVLYLAALSRSSVHAGVLYALGDFISAPLTISLRALVPLAILPFLPRGFTSIVLVIGGVAAGEILRSVVLTARVRRLSLRLEPAPAGDRTPPPPVWRAVRPHALSLLATTIAPVVDRVVASSLDTGAVTLIDIAEKLYYIPLTILISSYALVAGARWSENAGSDLPALQTDVRRGLRIGVLLAAGSGLLMFAAVCAVTVAAGDTFAGVPSRPLRELVGLLLIGLPAATILSLLARLLTSTGQTHVLPILSIIDLALSVTLVLVGAHLFGLNGIALASALVRIVNAMLFLVVVDRLFRAGFPPGRHTRRPPQRVRNGGSGERY